MWLLLLNIRFYMGFTAQWAVIAQFFFMVLAIFWLLWQLMALAIYPRLETPGLKLALRNAAILIGKNPLITFVTLGWLILLAVISGLMPAILVLAGGALAASLSTNTVDVLIRRELKAPPPTDPRSK
jgi:hypothetical protein